MVLLTNLRGYSFKVSKWEYTVVKFFMPQMLIYSLQPVFIIEIYIYLVQHQMLYMHIVKNTTSPVESDICVYYMYYISTSFNAIREDVDKNKSIVHYLRHVNRKS